MSNKVSKAASLFLAVLLVYLLFTFFHEGGHALIGAAFGGKISHFSINFFNFSASVGIQSALGSPGTSLMQIAGILFPFLIWLILIIVLPRQIDFLLEIILFLGGMAVVSSLLAWIIIPILYLNGQHPQDDSTHFLESSLIHPIWVSASFVLLFILGLSLLWRRYGPGQAFLANFQAKYHRENPFRRKSVSIALIILVVCLMSSFAINGFRFSTHDSTERRVLPDGFVLVKTINLQLTSYQQEIVYRFTLPSETLTGIYLQLTKFNTPYIDIQISGPGGFHSVLLHGEGYTASSDSSIFQQQLPAGAYQVQITSKASPGVLEIFSSTERP